MTIFGAHAPRSYQPAGDIGVQPDAEPSWQSRGACIGHDPDLFFPERGESIGEARMICWGCPVRAECLEYALVNVEKHGVWGGLSERQRRRIRSKRAAERRAAS